MNTSDTTMSLESLTAYKQLATLQGSIEGTTSVARQSDVCPSSRGVCQAVLLVNSRRPLAVSVCRQRNVAVKTTIRQSRFNQVRCRHTRSSSCAGGAVPACDPSLVWCSHACACTLTHHDVRGVGALLHTPSLHLTPTRLTSRPSR